MCDRDRRREQAMRRTLERIKKVIEAPPEGEAGIGPRPSRPLMHPGSRVPPDSRPTGCRDESASGAAFAPIALGLPARRRAFGSGSSAPCTGPPGP